MKAKEKYLTVHGIFENKSFEEHCSHIPTFYFKREVPEDVVRDFEIIEQLMAHSYYEYRFIDEAYAKSIRTLEMAMSIRYKDFYTDSSNKGFNTLLRKLYEKDVFDTSLEYLLHVKAIRNHHSHPERHSFGGITFWHRIETISRIINELYEDIDLRLARRKLKADFIEHYRNSIGENGVIVEVNGKVDLLFSIDLLFVNNKYSNPTYTFCCKPLFKLTDNKDSIVEPYVYKVKLNNIAFTPSGFTGNSLLHNGQLIAIYSSQNNPALAAFHSKWLAEYNMQSDIIKYMYENGAAHVGGILYEEVKDFLRLSL